jgi:hypothetical protein
MGSFKKVSANMHWDANNRRLSLGSMRQCCCYIPVVHGTNYQMNLKYPGQCKVIRQVQIEGDQGNSDENDSWLEHHFPPLVEPSPVFSS